MTAPISDEERQPGIPKWQLISDIYTREWNRVSLEISKSRGDRKATAQELRNEREEADAAGIRAVRAALQEPVAVPEWVEHIEASRWSDGTWHACVAPANLMGGRDGTGPDPIAAIRNAVEDDTP